MYSFINSLLCLIHIRTAWVAINGACMSCTITHIVVLLMCCTVNFYNTVMVHVTQSSLIKRLPMTDLNTSMIDKGAGSLEPFLRPTCTSCHSLAI